MVAGTMSQVLQVFDLSSTAISQLRNSNASQRALASNKLSFYDTAGEIETDVSYLDLYTDTTTSIHQEEMTDEEQEESFIRPLYAGTKGDNTCSTRNHQRVSSMGSEMVEQLDPSRLSIINGQRGLDRNFLGHSRNYSQTVTVIDDSPEKQPRSLKGNDAINTYCRDFNQFHIDQAMNHKQRQQKFRDLEQKEFTRSKILDKVSKWSRYSNSKENTFTTTGFQPQTNTNSHRRDSKVSRYPSVKGKDFSNTQEIKSYKKSGRYIFHRGFSIRRQKKSKSLRRLQKTARFRNNAELASFMEYIQLDSTPITDVLSEDHVLMTKVKPPVWKELCKVRPELVQQALSLYSYEVQLACEKDRMRSVTGSRSLKRPCISKGSNPHLRHISIKNSANKPLHRNSIRRAATLGRPFSSVRRTKSFPVTNSKAYMLQRQYSDLYQLWRKYLMAVVLQRVRFRIHHQSNLNGSASTASFRSDGDSDYSTNSSHTGSSFGLPSLNMSVKINSTPNRQLSPPVIPSERIEEMGLTAESPIVIGDEPSFRDAGTYSFTGTPLIQFGDENFDHNAYSLEPATFVTEMQELVETPDKAEEDSASLISDTSGVGVRRLRKVY